MALVSVTVGALAERMLVDACDLVASGWCRGTAARDELGREIEPSSAFARSWSAAGALERVWRRALEDDDLALEAFERSNLALAAAVRDVPQEWNDAVGRAQAEVVEALREATRLVRVQDDAPPDLAEDLLDDLSRYETLPSLLFEPPA